MVDVPEENIVIMFLDDSVHINKSTHWILETFLAQKKSTSSSHNIVMSFFWYTLSRYGGILFSFTNWCVYIWWHNRVRLVLQRYNVIPHHYRNWMVSFDRFSIPKGGTYGFCCIQGCICVNIVNCDPWCLTIEALLLGKHWNIDTEALYEVGNRWEVHTNTVWFQQSH